MRIAIIGAGIGGLATALSLHAAGLRDVAVYERVETIRGLGVGINLLPHATRELTELGLADMVGELGVAPQTLAYYNRYGQPIWSEPRGLAAGYRWPQLSVHRGHLQLALLDAVHDRLGDVVHTGHALDEVVAGDDCDVVRLRTPGGAVEVQAHAVIGADGIHSRLRQQHYPSEGGPVWSGLTLWRGTAEVDEFLDGHTMVMVGDGEQKFVAYPLRATDRTGRTRVNFIAEHRGDGGSAVDWNCAVEPAPVVELFWDWRFEWLDVPDIIARADAILEYPMVDRNPLPQWTFGRSTLLGDAAHALYPNGSNGASQAILDARTVAHRLATESSVEAALASYEAARRPVTTQLLQATRENGPERVMMLARERAPMGFTHIHDVIPASELEEIATSYKLAAGLHPEALNERPSLTPPNAPGSESTPRP